MRGLPVHSLLLLAALVAPPAAHAQLGVFAGLNFEAFEDIDAGDRRATLDNATGYHVGLYLDAAAGSLALRPGLAYRRIEDGELGFDLDDLPNGIDAQLREIDFSLIELFADVRLRLPLPVVQPYAFAGPVVGFPSASDEDLDEAFADAALWGNIGAGLDLGLGGLRLQPEIRYSVGMTGLTEEGVVIGDVTFDPDEALNLNTFMLRLGFVF